MKTFMALLKREYWEHRGAFIKAPIIIGTVFLVIIILGYFATDKIDVAMNNSQGMSMGIESLASLPGNDIQMFIDGFMLTTASFFHFVLFIILFFFLLGSLYDDRKDGSILFWKSLPISDTQMVLSKLVSALLVAPILFTIALILTHLAIFIFLSLIILFYGQNPFSIIWMNINFFSNWGAFFIGCMVQAVWALPIYGWLLLSSAYSKRRPFLMAVFVPTLIAFAWYWYNALVSFSFLKLGIFKTIGLQMGHAFIPFGSNVENSFDFDFDPKSTTGAGLIESMISSLYSVTIAYGLIFAAIAITLVIYVRRFRNAT